MKSGSFLNVGVSFVILLFLVSSVSALDMTKVLDIHPTAGELLPRDGKYLEHQQVYYPGDKTFPLADLYGGPITVNYNANGRYSFDKERDFFIAEADGIVHIFAGVNSISGFPLHTGKFSYRESWTEPGSENWPPTWLGKDVLRLDFRLHIDGVATYTVERREKLWTWEYDIQSKPPLKNKESVKIEGPKRERYEEPAIRKILNVIGI